MFGITPFSFLESKTLIFGRIFLLTLFLSLTISNFLILTLKKVSIEGVAELKIILQFEFLALTIAKSLKFKIS